jgi:hypothetical protein
MSIECYSPEHMVAAMIGWVGLLLYTIGFPIACFFVLRIWKKRVDTMGFFHSDLKKEWYWFNLIQVMTTHPTCPTSLLILLPRPTLIQLLSLHNLLNHAPSSVLRECVDRRDQHVRPGGEHGDLPHGLRVLALHQRRAIQGEPCLLPTACCTWSNSFLVLFRSLISAPLHTIPIPS